MAIPPATKPPEVGLNRTGIATSPIDSRRTIEAANAAGTVGLVDGKALETVRLRWARSAESIGTVPPPMKIEGHRPTVFIDKLGERLAYERTSTRLYEALIVKHAASTVKSGGPTRAELTKIHDDERAHFLVVRDAIAQLGADPTAMTPSADVIGVAGVGWVQVLADPRTTLTQCLCVMLTVEQGDVEGWDVLTQMAASLGFDDLATRFDESNALEREHVVKVRGWLTSALLGQAGLA
jgi:hypothetical protein